MSQGYYIPPIIDTYTNQPIKPNIVHLHIHVPAEPIDDSTSHQLTGDITRPANPTHPTQPTRYVPITHPQSRLRLWGNINGVCIQEPLEGGNPDIFRYASKQACQLGHVTDNTVQATVVGETL